MLSNVVRYQVQALCLYHLGAYFSYFMKDPNDPKWDTFSEWAEGNADFWIYNDFHDRYNWRHIKEYAKRFTKVTAEQWIKNAGLIKKSIDMQVVSI